MKIEMISLLVSIYLSLWTYRNDAYQCRKVYFLKAGFGMYVWNVSNKYGKKEQTDGDKTNHNEIKTEMRKAQ